MPFDVFGFVEIAYGTPAHGDAVWFSAIALDAFTIGGDAVSDLMFGLAKQPSGRGLYAERGIPPDSSALVRRDFEDGGAQHAFGHSYATLVEIDGIAWDVHGVDPSTSEWWTVLELVGVIRRRLGLTNDRVRIVVWATW
jgi:hypothetical protein